MAFMCEVIGEFGFMDVLDNWISLPHTSYTSGVPNSWLELHMNLCTDKVAKSTRGRQGTIENP